MKCPKCGKDLEGSKKFNIDGKWYCKECSTEAIEKLFNKIKSMNAQRKKERKGRKGFELPSSEEIK